MWAKVDVNMVAVWNAKKDAHEIIIGKKRYTLEAAKALLEEAKDKESLLELNALVDDMEYMECCDFIAVHSFAGYMGYATTQVSYGRRPYGA